MTTVLSTLKNGLIRSTTTVTCAATTAAGTIGDIRGEIQMIQVKNDTGSCGWWIFTDGSDNGLNQGEINDQDILGATGAGHVDTAAATYYPVKLQVLNTAVATDPDQYAKPIVDGTVEFDIDDCANNEVITIIIWYKEL